MTWVPNFEAGLPNPKAPLDCGRHGRNPLPRNDLAIGTGFAVERGVPDPCATTCGGTGTMRQNTDPTNRGRVKNPDPMSTEATEACRWGV